MRPLDSSVSWLVATLLAPIAATADSTALAPLPATELHRSCSALAQAPADPAGGVCSTYLRAFIEASPFVILVDDGRTQESFSERAARTRLGTVPIRPQFCIPASLMPSELAAQLVAQAQSNPPKDEDTAGTLLLQTLSRYHRCG
jgi:hypothetical protein